MESPSISNNCRRNSRRHDTRPGRAYSATVTRRVRRAPTVCARAAPPPAVPAVRAILTTLATLITLTTQAKPAAADGPTLGGPRGIGRAGAVMVSDDTGTALLLNPGGLARRTAPRVQLALGFHDRDLDYQAAAMPQWFPGSTDTPPPIRDQGAPARLPLIAVQGPIGPVVAGLALVETSDWSRALPAPGATSSLDAGSIARLFPHRYGGTLLTHRRRSLAAGAAVRARPWLGVGASVGLARVELREQRHIWAGVAGRDALANPQHDLTVAVTGRDDLVPGMAAGALIAPLQLPVEMAVSASYAAGGQVRGTADAWAPASSPLTQATLTAPTAQASLPHTLTMRVGLRYLGERILLESGSEMTVYLGQPPTWQIAGVSVQDWLEAPVPLASMPSLLDRRAHAAARASADVEIVPGFLWLSGGYAYRTSASYSPRMAPAHADPGGHTLAMGAEANWSGITLTVGYARSLARSIRVTESSVVWIAPRDDGGRQPVGAGTYVSAGDAFGAAVEIAWE